MFRRLPDSELFAWLTVTALSALTFLLFATAGHFPVVDLPQHALILARILDTPDAYEFNWTTPYTGFYLVSALFAQFFDPVKSVELAFSLSLAMLPLSSAVLAASLHKSPALGCLAFLGAFASPSAWGFAPLAFSAAIVGVSLAAAVWYARKPTIGRGALVATTILLAYSAHLLAWLVVLPAMWFVQVVRTDRVRPLELLPQLAGTLASLLLFDRWNTVHVHPPMMRELLEVSDSGPGLLTRLTDLPVTAAAVGRQGALLAPWTGLAAVFFVLLAIRLNELYRRRSDLLIPLKQGFRFAMRDCAVPSILIACVVCFLFAPLWMSGTFLIYPRFLLFGAILLPVILSNSTVRRAHRVALVGLLPAIWMVIAVRGEITTHHERISCIDTIATHMRPRESLASLNWATQPTGYSVPIDLHLGAMLTAKLGGHTDFDFSDFGSAPIVLRRGWRRIVIPSGHGLPKKLRRQWLDSEFTAWWLNQPPRALTTAFDGNRWQGLRCRNMMLYYDDSIAPGGREPRVFLPHIQPEE